MATPSDRRNLALGVVGAACFGGTIALAGAAARDGLDAPTAVSVRYEFAAVLLFGVLAAARRPFLPPPGERWRIAGLAVLGTAEAACFYLALQRGTAAAVALVFYTYPAVIAGIEVARGGLRLSRDVALALGLAISGAVAITAGGGDVAITPAGIAWISGSVVCVAVLVVLADRTLQQTDALTTAGWTTLGTSIGAGLLGAVAGQLTTPTGTLWAVLVGGGVCTGVAFTLFFLVLDRLGPTRTAVVMALEVIFAVLFATLFLDESISAEVAVGGIAVVVGAVLAARATPSSLAARELETP